MTQPSPRRLTVVSLDVNGPIKFAGPYGTVVFRIDPTGGVLNVYAQPETSALDWDVALSLMARVGDPRRKLPVVPSVLRGLSFWEVELVEYPTEYLLLASMA